MSIVLLSLIVTLATAQAVAPMKLAPAVADTLKAAIEKDRKDTEDWLAHNGTSYLAAVARRDFGAKTTLTVGRAEDNDVRVDEPAVMAHHLSVTVVGDSFRVQAVDEGATFKVRDQVTRGATLSPQTIFFGRYALRLSHQGYPALIVFDSQAPGFSRYHGLKWFPVDFNYRYEVALDPSAKLDTVVILATHSQPRRAVRVGWFNFKVGSTACCLEATRLLEPGVGEKDVSVFFRDATTGKESYTVGRYVEPERLPDGRFVLDFNNAYNPACAVSDYYNCPIPTKANTLKVAIRAGEMDAHYH